MSSNYLPTNNCQGPRVNCAHFNGQNINNSLIDKRHVNVVARSICCSISDGPVKLARRLAHNDCHSNMINYRSEVSGGGSFCSFIHKDSCCGCNQVLPAYNETDAKTQIICLSNSRHRHKFCTQNNDVTCANQSHKSQFNHDQLNENSIGLLSDSLSNKGHNLSSSSQDLCSSVNDTSSQRSLSPKNRSSLRVSHQLRSGLTSIELAREQLQGLDHDANQPYVKADNESCFSLNTNRKESTCCSNFVPIGTFSKQRTDVKDIDLGNKSTCNTDSEYNLESDKTAKRNSCRFHDKVQQQPSYSNWTNITDRFGKMARKQYKSSNEDTSWRNSCFVHMLLSTTCAIFPIFESFKNYTLPSDLLDDFFTGFTVAVLHIPQGMAYGLLAGVEPINGLYTSLVPVLLMALMGRSRHVSYGTFAIVSMLLSNIADNVKENLRQTYETQSKLAAAQKSHSLFLDTPPNTLVLSNNHRPQAIVTQINSRIQDYFLDSSPTTAIPQAPVSAIGEPLIHNDLDNKIVNSSPILMDANFIMPSNAEVLTCVCLIVGLMQLVMSFMRLGILSLMFSDQLVSSFTTASAVHVIVAQMASLFDIDNPSIPGEFMKLFKTCYHVTEKLMDGFNYYTAILSLASILFLLLIKELIEPKLKSRYRALPCIPSELILMMILIFCSWYWKLSDTLDIRIIGYVPTGLPVPESPRLELTPLVLEDSLTIALLSFAMNLSLAQIYAKRDRYKLEANHELFAQGSTNVISSFFGCLPCGSSLSRTSVIGTLRPKSQLCPIVSCIFVLLTICYFAPILHDLPKSTLSCIIVVALKGILLQTRDLYENWRLSKLDALVWIVTFSSTLIFGVTNGLIIGIISSLFVVFIRLLNPNHSILGQLPGTEIYVDRDAFMECQEIGQVKIFRFNSALCYLNRTIFKESIEKSMPTIYKPKGLNSIHLWRAASQNLENPEKTKFLIIDCSALAYCDYSGASTLVEIIEELDEYGVMVFLAACPIKLIEMFEKMRKIKVLENNVFPTITDAVGQTRHCNLNLMSSSRDLKQQITSITNSNESLSSVVEHRIIN